MKKINVAIIGLGNCAKSLIEGVAKYSESQDPENGLAFQEIGGYKPENIKFVLAFDVDVRKTYKQISKAMYEKPNCALDLVEDRKIVENVCSNNPVIMGKIMDGVSPHMEQYPDDERFMVDYENEELTPEKFVEHLKKNNIDVVLNYLPVGSHEATEFYINGCIEAKVPFVNCIPEFIVSNPVWQKKLIEAGIPAIGDDMKSAVGASIISAALHELFLKRGAEINIHYQDNVGGNTDFLNMQNKERLTSKKTSKENVIKNQNKIVGKETKPNTVHAGPANYFPALGDNKKAHWLIQGTIFGGAKFEFTADLSCQDSPNSAGVVIDAIRLLQVARELKMVGSIFGPSAWTQKTPPKDMHVEEAYKECKSLAERKIPENYVENAEGNFVYNA